MKGDPVYCSRCGKYIGQDEGVENATSGYYRVDVGSAWRDFARDGEVSVCDPCMFVDEKYIAIYGKH